MNRRRTAWIPAGMLTIALALAAVAMAPSRAGAQAAGDTSLTVTVTYTGKGEVTPANALLVFLFDSATINDSSIPVGMQKIEKSGGSVTFTPTTSPAYIVVTYDEKGTYAGGGPPPPGTPYTIYQAKAKNTPATAVKVGKGTKISVTFDGSQRW